jgi:hypothetical protein
MRLGQLLMREGGTEISVALTKERQRVLAGRVREAPVARTATPA